MASVINLSKVKQHLQISGANQDALISQLIASFKSQICERLRNHFHAKSAAIPLVGPSEQPFLSYVESTGISFDGDQRRIDITSSGAFADAGFADGMDCHVEGSRLNDGIYEILLVDDDGVQLVDEATINDEDALLQVRVSIVVFPAGMLPGAARVIQHWMNKREPSVISEALADESYSYSGDGGIPVGLLKEFTPWRNMYPSYR